MGSDHSIHGKPLSNHLALPMLLQALTRLRLKILEFHSFFVQRFEWLSCFICVDVLLGIDRKSLRIVLLALELNIKV